MSGNTIPRCLGAVYGSSEGPMVVLTGGLHGNEPGGMLAARQVIAELGAFRSSLRGSVIAFSGNRAALAHGVRFVSRDLNRGWRTPELDRLHRVPRDDLAFEDAEQRDLYDAFTRLEDGSSRLLFFDLHTTSGPTEPFLCVMDTPENRALACALPVNVVVGLEKMLEASMLSWVSARGHLGMSFEAGQHDDPAARERHISAIWTLLVAVGALEPGCVPDEIARRTWQRSGTGARVVEVTHRHVVEPGDQFEMLEGFEGFDPIEVGQIVARDRRGPVRAPESGLMLMPRYQTEGEDGFFLARDVPCR